MKKILVAAAVAFIGFAVHAASVEWSAYPVYEMGTEEVVGNYLIYFFDNDVYATNEAMTSLSNGSSDFISNGFESYGGEEGFFMGAGADDYANGATINGYLVIFNAETVDAATHAYISTVEVGEVGASGQIAAIEFDTTTTSIAGNWTALGGAAVPEPTSALMLLVGLASLALKRKVA